MAHVHTCFSGDGELTPSELAELARARGFDAILVTDHFESLTASRFAELQEACAAVTECLVAPGYERSWDGYHILALGVRAWFDDPDLAAWARRVRASGGITVLAHPSRYGHRIPERILAACDAVEVWNSKFAYDGRAAPNPAAYRLLGTRRYPLCGQDLHGTRHASSVALHLPRSCATTREILDCLARGEYTMGNRLWRLSKSLPASLELFFGVFHSARRVAVNTAIRARRRVQRMVRKTVRDAPK